MAEFENGLLTAGTSGVVHLIDPRHPGWPIRALCHSVRYPRSIPGQPEPTCKRCLTAEQKETK